MKLITLASILFVSGCSYVAPMPSCPIHSTKILDATKAVTWQKLAMILSELNFGIMVADSSGGLMTTDTLITKGPSIRKQPVYSMGITSMGMAATVRERVRVMAFVSSIRDKTRVQIKVKAEAFTGSSWVPVHSNGKLEARILLALGAGT